MTELNDDTVAPRQACEMGSARTFVSAEVTIVTGCVTMRMRLRNCPFEGEDSRLGVDVDVDVDVLDCLRDIAREGSRDVFTRRTNVSVGFAVAKLSF